MKAVQKIVILTLIIIGFTACDESGRVDSGLFGLWEHLGDSIITVQSMQFDTPVERGMLLSTMELLEAGAWIKQDEYPDTVYTHTGTWNVTRNRLTLENEGWSYTRDYELDGDHLTLSYSSFYEGPETRYVAVYHRLE